MKKLLSICTFLLFSISIFSQGTLISPNWQIKRIGVSFVFDQDMLKGMYHTYFLSTIRGNTDYNYSNLNLTEEYIGSMACENPHIRLNMTLLPPAMKNTELNLALVGIFNRIDYVSYSTPGARWGDPDYQSMTFDAITNEIDLEATMVKRLPIGRAINFYAGAGTNLGVSFGGNLSVHGNNITMENDNVIGLRNDVDPSEDYFDMEYFSEYYDTKSAFSQRVFGQIGLGFTILRRFELNLDYRHGLGYRAIAGAPIKATELRSVGVGMRWVLR